MALHGYIYRVNRRGPDKVFWRCAILECSATVSTENNIPVGFGRKQHNDPADHTQLVAKQIMNLVTERCAKEVKPIPSIYSEELNKLMGQRMGRYQQRSSVKPAYAVTFIKQSPVLKDHIFLVLS